MFEKTQALQIKTYGELMETHTPCLTPESTLAQAAQLLQSTCYRVLPVITQDDNTILGIIRLDSLLSAFAEGRPPGTPVKDLMEKAPLVVSPNDVCDFGSGAADIIMVASEEKLLGVIHSYMRESYLLPQISLLFSIFLDAIPYPIVAVNDKGIVWTCNEAFSQLIPGGKQSVLNRYLSSIIAGSQLYKVARNGQAEKWQSFKFAGRTFLVNRAPLIVNNRHIGALATLHDTSELEQVSNELQNVRMLTEELNSIIESSFDGIYVTDGQGTTLRVNKAYERISGLKAEDVVGHTMQDLVERNIFDQSSTIGVLATKAPCTVVQKIRNSITVIASGLPVFDNAGKLVRVVTTVRDVTELNDLQDKLREADNLRIHYEEELRELKNKLHQLKDSNMASYSPAMQHLLNLALQLSTVDSTVLIQGDSGVGKEWIANIIHNHSARKDMPFIKINCAAIPETLLESELFGYARGAFTGANREGKRGLFEAANGGTILLDEIGDISPSLQVKLLRVLQERQTRRVGEHLARDIDVRVIAATNHNLFTLVQSHKFRQDLYYRLNVVPITVPPLCERREDIMFLAHSFLQKFCAHHERDKKLHPSLLPILLSYSWPGNVRELENLMERLVVTSLGPVITPEDLPPSVRQTQPSRQLSFDIEGKNLKEITDAVESKVLQLAFSQHKTTRQVARALGINQSSVVRKSRRLNLFAPANT